MWNRKLSRALPVLLVVAFLAAPSAFAAPSPDAAVPARILQVVADWWAGLTGPMARIFDFNRAGVDPDGAPSATTSTGDPTADTEHRHGIDPDG